MSPPRITAALLLYALACCGGGRDDGQEELQRDVKQLLGEVTALREQSARLHDDVRSLRAELAALKIEKIAAQNGKSARGDAGPEGQIRISIHSTPSGARVSCDGHFAGKTPLAFPGTPGAELRLVIEKTGFAPVHRTLTPTRDTTLSIRLAPQPDNPGDVH